MNSKYIIAFFFLMLSSKANFLSKIDAFWFLMILYLLWMGLQKGIFLKKEINYYIAFFFTYLALIFFRNFAFNHLGSDFLVSDVLFLFKYITVTFLFCAVLKEDAPEYIIRVVKDLTVISFFFYFFQILGLSEILYNVIKKVDFSGIAIPGYANCLIFSITIGRHDFRNSGFVWEPGAFGCFLIITLMLHFFRNNFTFDKIAKILILGVITTLSTTNYIALLILLFLMYRYRVRRINFGIVLLIPLVLIIFFSVPILGDKISQTMDGDSKGLDDMKNLSRFYTLHNEEIPLNRFASMTYIYDMFKYKLILGVSNKYDVIVTKEYNVNISNGIFDFLAKFGFIGLAYLVYRFMKYCKVYVIRNELVFYCLVILMVLSFGEPILFAPLFLTFMFLPISGIDYQQFLSEENDEYLMVTPV